MGFAANPRNSAFLLVVAISVSSALAGCYTVLKHPPTADLYGDTAVGHEDRRDCFDCHSADGPAFAYDPLAAVGFDYFNDYWYPFYAYPWWYRDYWYYDRFDNAGGGSGGSGGGGGAAGTDDSRRHLWGRGTNYGPPSLPPIYIAPSAPAAPTGPASGGAPGQPETGQQPGRTMKDGTSTPPSPSSGSDKKKDAEEDKKERDSKKDDDRNVWRRGGGKKS
jgi:hypothetical protein